MGGGAYQRRATTARGPEVGPAKPAGPEKTRQFRDRANQTGVPWSRSMAERSQDVEITKTQDGVWVASSTGRARVARISNTVVRVDLDGHCSAEFAAPIQAALDELIATRGRLYIGVDAEAMASYDSRFRYLWTEWIKTNEKVIDGLLVLFRSQMIRVAVVVNNAVAGAGVVQSSRDRDEFEDQLYDAVLRCRGRG